MLSPFTIRVDKLAFTRQDGSQYYLPVQLSLKCNCVTPQFIVRKLSSGSIRNRAFENYVYNKDVDGNGWTLDPGSRELFCCNNNWEAWIGKRYDFDVEYDYDNLQNSRAYLIDGTECVPHTIEEFTYAHLCLPDGKGGDECVSLKCEWITKWQITDEYDETLVFDNYLPLPFFPVLPAAAKKGRLFNANDFIWIPYRIIQTGKDGAENEIVTRKFTSHKEPWINGNIDCWGSEGKNPRYASYESPMNYYADISLVHQWYECEAPSDGIGCEQKVTTYAFDVAHANTGTHYPENRYQNHSLRADGKYLFDSDSDTGMLDDEESGDWNADGTREPTNKPGESREEWEYDFPLRELHEEQSDSRDRIRITDDAHCIPSYIRSKDQAEFINYQGAKKRLTENRLGSRPLSGIRRSGENIEEEKPYRTIVSENGKLYVYDKDLGRIDTDMWGRCAE